MPAKRRNTLESCILAEYWVRPSPWEAHTLQLDLKGIGPVLPSQCQVKLEEVWTQKAAGDSGKAWASPTAYASAKWGNTKILSYAESCSLALVKSEMHSLIWVKKIVYLFHWLLWADGQPEQQKGEKFPQPGIKKVRGFRQFMKRL